MFISMGKNGLLVTERFLLNFKVTPPPVRMPDLPTWTRPGLVVPLCSPLLIILESLVIWDTLFSLLESSFPP